MCFFRSNSKNCILEAMLEFLASSTLLRTSSHAYSYSSTVLFINRPPSTNRKMAGFWLSLHPSLMLQGQVPTSPCLALALALAVPAAQAYEPTLTPAALHDAYVLGQRNDQTTAEFLDPYSKQIAGAAEGGTPHLSEIEVLTPFASGRR